MDPNTYIGKHIPQEKPLQSAAPVKKAVKSPAPADNVPHVRRKAPAKGKTGKLYVSGKRFFGQILIDHWVLRINGEQRELPFGQNKLSLDLPAGMYLVTAYTPYLGMHCMKVTSDIEIRPGMTTHIFYKTVFDIFKNGVMKHNINH